ncbi:MAG: AAC(3) family N-acetyltransferase [Minwuia sp.]|uniref:AAC(3) family N-acetyltransferase n=1 Tax=Minwuia sp. TaxID=2493630 RepID=UPI003A8A0639
MTTISHQATLSAFKEALEPGDDVFVHASLGRIGHFEAGPDGVIEALCSAVGASGTVIMMTDTRSFAETGRFSMAQPSETGLLTERFRLTPGVKRSCVPMVSYCAKGPKAEFYTEPYNSHLDETATLTRLLAEDGKIMLLGIGYGKCTLYHLAEERHCSPTNFYKEFRGVLAEEGKPERPISQRYFVRKDLNTRKDPSVAGRMLEERALATVLPLGNDAVRVFRARDFDACCMEALNTDPNAFLVSSTAK